MTDKQKYIATYPNVSILTELELEWNKNFKKIYITQKVSEKNKKSTDYSIIANIIMTCLA